MLQLVGALATALLAALLATSFAGLRRLRRIQLRAPPFNQESEELLLVIAHPDDESMFFLPTCLAFKRKRILCLSNGDFDGLGKVREKELNKAAQLLGFTEVYFSDFVDGFNEHWDAQRIAEAVADKVGKETVIVTFDRWGVSGHPNHIATHNGVRELVRRSPGTRAFQLVSDRWLPIKYSGPIGAYLKALFGSPKDTVVLLNDDVSLAYRAMATHHSQFVWFRRAFVLIARCTMLNVLERIS